MKLSKTCVEIRLNGLASFLMSDPVTRVWPSLPEVSSHSQVKFQTIVRESDHSMGFNTSTRPLIDLQVVRSIKT